MNDGQQNPRLEVDFAIRPIRSSDMPALKSVIAAAELFPPEMLDDMVAGYLSGDAGEDIWLTLDDGGPVAVAYCAPERMTSGTWNVYLIAIHPDRQRAGLGSAIMKHVEQSLRARDGRILLVETSALPAFENTRAFYSKIGYEEEARIRDFYQAGEDKIVFRKVLGLPSAN